MTKKAKKNGSSERRLQPDVMNHDEFEASARAFFESPRGNAVQRLGKRVIARTKIHDRKIPNDGAARFRGLPVEFPFDLFPGLHDLVETAAGQRKLLSGEDFAASREALQQIADGAVGFFHAVTYFAGLGQPWAVRILAEFAVASTSVVEGAIANRPLAPMKAVPLWPSPEDKKKNDAHTLTPDSAFAALLQFFRNQRELPVLIRRSAKAFNAGKLMLPAAVELGSGLNERINKRKPPSAQNPLNRLLDRYLGDINQNEELRKGLPELVSKADCRQWALRILEIFEQQNGPAIDHPLFTWYHQRRPTRRGRRGAIRDAIQNALFRRIKNRV